MKENCFRVICLLCVIGLCLFTPSVLVAGEKDKASEKQKKKTVAEEQIITDETKSIKETQGRIDSIRPEKIIITYEPEDQEGVQLQAYYLRDKNTKFLNQSEEKLKAGDIVEVTYEQSEWTNAEGKKRMERIAKTVRFICSRAVEELRKKTQEMGTKQRRGDVSEDGTQ